MSNSYFYFQMAEALDLAKTTKEMAVRYIRGVHESLKNRDIGLMPPLAAGYQKQRVEAEFQKFMTAQTTIIAAIKDANDKNQEYQQIQDMDEMCAELYGKFHDYNKQIGKAGDPLLGGHAAPRKAPENLVDFDGSHSKWPGFRDLFKALVIDVDYSVLERFLLLRKHCKGPAEEIVAGYPPIEASFALAWDSLKDIFEDTYSITQSLVDKLIDLAPVKSRGVVEMRRVIDTFRSTLRQLQAMGIDVDAWDAMMINMLARKVPPGMVHEWEQQRNKKDAPKLIDFTTYLDGKARLRVFATECQSTRRQQPPANNANSTSNNFNAVASNDGRRPLFTSKGGPRLCHKCKGEHLIYQCPEFAAMADVKQREAEAARLNLCANCLRFGHSLADCKGEGCRECQGAKHNRLLCPKPRAQKRDNQRVNFASKKQKKSNAGD